MLTECSSYNDSVWDHPQLYQVAFLSYQKANGDKQMVSSHLDIQGVLSAVKDAVAWIWLDCWTWAKCKPQNI